MITNVVIFSEAIYLRAHKQEVFFINSIVGAVAVTMFTLTFGRYYGARKLRSIPALAIFSGWFGRPTNSENTADYGTLLEGDSSFVSRRSPLRTLLSCLRSTFYFPSFFDCVSFF